MNRGLASALIALSCAACVHGASTARVNQTRPEGIPKALKIVEPTYPVAARQNKVNGCVTLAFDIMPDGKTDHYQLIELQPPGIGMFEWAALKALAQWRFEPSDAVHRTQMTFVFKLDQPALHDYGPCRAGSS